MKRFLVILGLIVAAFLVYKLAFKKKGVERAKPQSVAVSKHTDAFNQSVHDILGHYDHLKDGFVNWDMEVVNKSASLLLAGLSEFNMEELKKDSVIYQTALLPVENAKNSAQSVLNGKSWEEKRMALQDLSENLRMLLITVKYDGQVLYWQECPMAFGEGSIGNWISDKEAIVNPYLGNKHPKYGNTMVGCGETKEKIDFRGADSTTKK